MCTYTCAYVIQSFKASGQSPFEVDVELLRQQKPGLILTQVSHQA